MPPTDPPRASRSKPKRKSRQTTQPPSSTARQNAAFGSRPARPLPKPKPPRPARVPQPARGTTPAPVRVVQKAARTQKPAPVAKPTARQTRNARVQGKAYVSQGKAVSRAARKQQQAAALTSVGGGDFDTSLAPTGNRHAADVAAAAVSKRIGHKVYLGDDKHYYAHVKRTGLPDRHIPVDPFTGKADRKYQASGKAKGGELEQAAIQAPALKALDQATRPLHAVAAQNVAAIKRGGIKEAFIGVHAPGSKEAKQSRRAFKRGLQLKDRSLGSDVLQAAGVKNKTARGVGGFVLDVLQDPLTPLTGGTGSVAEKAAVKAATRVSRKAVRHGVDKEAAQRLAATAAKQARKAAPTGRGVTVHFAGQEVPGVRRATAKVARGTRKATRKVVGDRLATEIPAAARNIVREVAPRVRAPGVSHEQMATARSLARSGRSRVSESANRADLLESDFVRRLKGDDKTRVVNAIERNKLSRIIGPDKKAIDKLAEKDPKEFARRQALAQKVHRARSEMAGEYRAGLRSGAIQKQRPGEYLTKGDLGRLDKTIASEQAQQRRAVVRAGREETRFQHRAEMTAQEATLRGQGRAAVTREQEIGAARRGVVRAQKTLRTELAKPVTQRHGVPALEAKVQQARKAWQQARRPARERIPTPAPVAPRAGQAANRYERRAATTQLAQQRHAAAHSIPQRSLQETPEAYLRRVHQHAVKHDLPLVRRRAETLLAKKPSTRARGYYPHITQQEIRTGEQSLLGKLSGRDVTGEPRVTGGQVARTARDTRAGKRRVENRPLNVLNPERVVAGKAPYSTDVPLVVPNYIREVARSSQPAEFAKGIAAQVGRDLKPGEALNQGEELYRLGFKGGKYGLHKESGRTAVPAARPVKAGSTVRTETAVPSGRSGGQYVALPSNFFENIESTLAGTRSKHNMKIIQGLDATQNLWKRGAITTLAFHVRNMIGDVAAGYNLPGAGGSLSKILSAIKVTRRASESHRFLRPRNAAEQKGFERAVLKPNEKSTIKAGGKEMSLDDFIKLGVENGVPDTGRIARDILGSAGGEAKLHATARGRSVTRPFRGRAGNRVNVWLTSRENVMRWAAFKHGLDRGMTPAEAADMASLYHIDYGEMSSFEREVLRRAAPFYTWTARSLPVAALTAIQRPGKFANLEAAREETGQAFTGDTETAIRDAMPDSVKRQVPVVIRVGNSNYAVSASLPVTLLNEFPDPGNPGKFLDEAWHFGFGMVGPYGTPVPGVGVKQLFELGMNKSAFTRRDIRPQYTAGRVPAPEWVGRMPDVFKKQVGAVQGPDKDTGKKVWFWDGRVDYGTRLLPGAAQQASQAAAGARPNQEKLPTAVGIASPITGVRVDKLGKKAATQTGRAQLSKELTRLQDKAELFNLQGIHSDNATAEYRAVRKRINAINKVLHPRKRKGGGGTGLSPSDIGLGSSGSDLSPSDIGLGG